MSLNSTRRMGGIADVSGVNRVYYACLYLEPRSPMKRNSARWLLLVCLAVVPFLARIAMFASAADKATTITLDEVK